MDNKLLADTALLAGEIMLRSGAEAYRVEDTICRILRLSGLKKADAFVTATGIVATLDDKTVDAITLVKRIDSRNTNLNNIYMANDISRKLCANEITLEDAFQRLKKVRNLQLYSNRRIWLCTVLVASFFSVLLGGGFIDVIITTFNGIMLATCIYFFGKLKLSSFITNMTASFIVAVSTMIFLEINGTGMNQEVVTTSSIMPLVPGVAITNAIRDSLQGDYMAGVARILEAFMAATSIAVGVGAGMAFYAFLRGGL